MEDNVDALRIRANVIKGRMVHYKYHEEERRKMDQEILNIINDKIKLLEEQNDKSQDDQEEERSYRYSS